MSSFLLDQKFINQIVTSIYENHDHQFVWTRAGWDVQSMAGIEELAKALHDLNVKALVARYDDDPDTMPFEGFEYETPLAPVALQKLMRCLRYQCSEGDVPEMPLYVTLDQACGALAESIVADLPEYDLAPWG